MDDEYSELEDEYFTEDWEDVEEYDEEYEHDEGERYEYLSAHEEELEGDELDDPDQETEDGDDRDDDLVRSHRNLLLGHDCLADSRQFCLISIVQIEEQGDDHWAGGSSFEEDLPDQPEEYRHKLHNTSEWPPKRSFEKRIDAAETYDPDSPGSKYFPIPVREPDGSWEEGTSAHISVAHLLTNIVAQSNTKFGAQRRSSSRQRGVITGKSRSATSMCRGSFAAKLFGTCHYKVCCAVRAAGIFRATMVYMRCKNMNEGVIVQP